MNKISVLLADDHTLVRQGLKALLTAEGDMEIIAEAEDGREAVALAKKTLPQVVVMDIAMPMMNGRDATRQIVRNCPETKVVVLSSYSDDACVRELLEAGATGFLMKQTASTELSNAIRQARRGARVLSPDIIRRMKAQGNGAFMEGGLSGKLAELTDREIEVLKIIAEGLSNREIAVRLGISIKTVEKHRQQVMNKLNIHEVAGLTRYALSQGLVEKKVPVGV